MTARRIPDLGERVLAVHGRIYPDRRTPRLVDAISDLLAHLERGRARRGRAGAAGDPPARRLDNPSWRY